MMEENKMCIDPGLIFTRKGPVTLEDITKNEKKQEIPKDKNGTSMYNNFYIGFAKFYKHETL